MTIEADEQAQRLLDWAANVEGADPASFHAVTIGDSIFVRPEYLNNVRVLREELIHVFQQRGGIGSDQLVKGEMEARLQMIRFRHRPLIEDVRARVAVKREATARQAPTSPQRRQFLASPIVSPRVTN